MPPGERHAALITLTSETGETIDARAPKLQGECITTTFEELPPGAYDVTITGLETSSLIAPITSTTLIWG